MVIGTLAGSKGISAIITDLGGVLVNVDKSRMCRKLAKYSILSAEELYSNFSRTVLTKTDLNFGKGLVTPKQFYRHLSKKLKLKSLGFEKFAMIYSNIFKRNAVVLRLLSRLSKNYNVALLSNTDALHFKSWSRLLSSDMEIFKAFILSFRIHAAKPGIKIFAEAARRLKVKPQQCVFIDDVEEYVEAAKKLGMCGIRFVSVKQLQRDLKKCGVAL